MKIKLGKTDCAGNQKSKLGFSLVEQIVATAVLGVAFTSLYGSISSGFATVQLARENLRATQILQEKMETIRLYTLNQVNTPGFLPPTFQESFYPVGPTNNGVIYTGTTTVTNAPFSANYTNDLKMATFQITWMSGKVQRQRSMTTYISRYGLQNYVY